MKGVDIMSTKPINFRVEEDLKEKAEALLADMGLTMSSAVSLFLKQMVNKQAIPFDIEASDPFYSQANQAELQRRLDNYDSDNKVSRDLIEVD